MAGSNSLAIRVAQPSACRNSLSVNKTPGAPGRGGGGRPRSSRPFRSIRLSLVVMEERLPGVPETLMDVHSGSSIREDREGLERIARDLLRPPLAHSRLKRRADGKVILKLKRPWRDGTAGMVFEPLDFLAKLAVLVPPARMNTIRFHGVYAPNAKLRSCVVPLTDDNPEDCPCSDGKGPRDRPLSPGVGPTCRSRIFH